MLIAAPDDFHFHERGFCRTAARIAARWPAGPEPMTMMSYLSMSGEAEGGRLILNRPRVYHRAKGACL